jgi:peptidyl-tRNA hydrolase
MYFYILSNIYSVLSVERAELKLLSCLSIDAGMVEGVPVLLAKPQTYMNLSGESVSITFRSLSMF